MLPTSRKASSAVRDPAKIRAIYSELRAALGTDAPAGLLLRLAHLILQAYDPEADSLDRFGRPRDSKTFFGLPVDEAMSDGGWQVLNFETRRNFGIDEADIDELAILKLRVGKKIGLIWHRALPEG